jgi:transcriptional regulator with XRE-family HTH domain
MTEADSPSVRERRLARELREARVGAQLAGNAVANLTGWSASKVSRIETGRIGISPADLDRLIELYQVPDEQAKYLRRLAPTARARGWWDAYADSLSSGYSGLLRLESGSQSLSSYCAVVPHPLLMTPEYIREVVLSTWQTPSAQELSRRIRVCLRRQAVLEHNDPHPRLKLSAVLDEAVLRRSATPPGSAEAVRIHHGQLERLMTVACWPNVTIRVLPFAAGVPPVSAGSFSVLDSRATGAPDVVYLENKTRIFFVDAEAEVDRYARDFELLTTMALSPEDSVEFIRGAMTGLANTA